MALDIRGLGNQEALSQIAKLAYGSGALEKTSGGKGNIGLIDGRVVKFNTHWRERGGVPSQAMRADCDALRTKLSEIATSMLSASPEATPQERATFQKALADVRKLLGMAEDGGQIATTKLLDRKVVAKVINTIDKATGFDAWEGLRAGDAARAFSSRGVDTTFGSVRSGFDLASIARDAAASLKHPADGKPGVTLNEKAMTFLTDLIDRDVAAREAAGLPVPTHDELDMGIRNFTSPYLIYTVQTFNLSGPALINAHESLSKAEQSIVFLSGAPKEQCADRVDVAVSLLAEANDDNRFLSGFAMSLVSEKMSEMRQLQPQGRLTGATVWKACFGEPAPEKAGAFGSRTFSDAFFARLGQQATATAVRYGGEEYEGQPLMFFAALAGTSLFNGMSFTASMRNAVDDKTFVPDVNRDYVAAPTLYTVHDAMIKTDEDRMKGICLDFARNFPVVKTRNGETQATSDFRQFAGTGINDRTIRPHVKAFLDQMDGVFGKDISKEQRAVVQMGLTQAGFATFMALLGVGGEHSAAQVSITRDEKDDSIVMTFESMPNSKVEARYSFRIEKDGTNYRVGDLVCRKNPQSEPAA